jgi:hypothetical protein
MKIHVFWEILEMNKNHKGSNIQANNYDKKWRPKCFGLCTQQHSWAFLCVHLGTLGKRIWFKERMNMRKTQKKSKEVSPFCSQGQHKKVEFFNEYHLER